MRRGGGQRRGWLRLMLRGGCLLPLDTASVTHQDLGFVGMHSEGRFCLDYCGIGKRSIGVTLGNDTRYQLWSRE